MVALSGQCKNKGEKAAYYRCNGSGKLYTNLSLGFSRFTINLIKTVKYRAIERILSGRWFIRWKKTLHWRFQLQNMHQI
jgi:hypothetical protein